MRSDAKKESSNKSNVEDCAGILGEGFRLYA